MKSTTFCFSIVLIVFLVTPGRNYLSAQPAAPILTEQPAPEFTDPYDILAATIQIIAFLPGQPTGEAASSKIFFEMGLASLIEVGNEIILISHDHWVALPEIVHVQFLDVDNRLLTEISGDEFRGLIRYQDQGTMILSIPPEIHPSYRALMASRSSDKEVQPILPGRLENAQDFQVGDVVTIAYRVGEDRCQVGLLNAQIVEVFELEGLPAFKLQSLNGMVIQPGDSGGGIWLDGELVGTMWMSEMIVKESELAEDSSQKLIRFTDISIAAQLPETVQISPAQGVASTSNCHVEDDEMLDGLRFGSASLNVP